MDIQYNLINVVVHLDSSVTSGVISMPPKSRLSDFLNSPVKFITLTDASITNATGTIEKVKEIHINKEAIKFLVTEGQDACRGEGGISQVKMLPIVQKIPIRTKMFMTDFEINCNVHCPNERMMTRLLLESDLTFLPCTDIKAHGLQSNLSWEAGFAAINRNKIYFLQKLDNAN